MTTPEQAELNLLAAVEHDPQTVTVAALLRDQADPGALASWRDFIPQAQEILAVLTTPPPQVWQIWVYNGWADHPDWEPTGDIYRHRENAQAEADRLNAAQLAAHNHKQRQWHDAERTRHREERALFTAGLRDHNPTDEQLTAEYTPVTELPSGRAQTLYEVRPVEFEDDPTP